MIIKRRFEIIGKLLERDEQAKKIIMEEMLKRYDFVEAERILTADYGVFLYLADMGSAIPNLNFIIEKMDELDESVPYDNGLTYSDVTAVQLFPSRQGCAAVLCMISKHADMPERIAQIIAVENENCRTKIIKPWNIDNVIV